MGLKSSVPQKKANKQAKKQNKTKKANQNRVLFLCRVAHSITIHNDEEK